MSKTLLSYGDMTKFDSIAVNSASYAILPAYHMLLSLWQRDVLIDESANNNAMALAIDNCLKVADQHSPVSEKAILTPLQ